MKGGDPSSLYSPGEVTPTELYSILGSPVQERHRCTGESPAKGHEFD